MAFRDCSIDALFARVPELLDHPAKTCIPMSDSYWKAKGWVHFDPKLWFTFLHALLHTFQATSEIWSIFLYLDLFSDMMSLQKSVADRHTPSQWPLTGSGAVIRYLCRQMNFSLSIYYRGEATMVFGRIVPDVVLVQRRWRRLHFSTDWGCSGSRSRPTNLIITGHHLPKWRHWTRCVVPMGRSMCLHTLESHVFFQRRWQSNGDRLFHDTLWRTTAKTKIGLSS